MQAIFRELIHRVIFGNTQTFITNHIVSYLLHTYLERLFKNPNNKKGLEIATEQCRDKLSNFGSIFVTLGKVLELSKFLGSVFNSVIVVVPTTSVKVKKILFHSKINFKMYLL